MSDSQIYFHHHKTPVGPLLLAGTKSALHLISFPTGSRARESDQGWVENKSAFGIAISQLDEYFTGQRQQFSISFELSGTAFQKQVWLALADIPYGQTISYGELANRIDRPKASRAVGAANGANNLPVILPCHRVIGANNTLTGFGGGIPTKKFLLELERSVAPQPGQQGRLFT